MSFQLKRILGYVLGFVLFYAPFALFQKTICYAMTGKWLPLTIHSLCFRIQTEHLIDGKLFNQAPLFIVCFLILLAVSFIFGPVYCGKLAYGRRKTEKVNGARNEYHIVKQDEYPIYDGVHDAIISEEDWLLAQAKRKKTGIKNEKVYSLEHQHLLSGIVCCPECGQPMYGSVNRKRKKDGTFYRDYWYYACKHRLELDGHKCTYKKQIHQERVNSAVEEFISKIVKNPKFEEAIKQKISARIDTDEIETEIESLNKKLRQLNMAKDKLGKTMDNLDVFDEFYNKKYDDMQIRLDSLYRDIDETEKELSAIYERLQKIRKDKISQEKVYQFLLFFDIIYPKFTDAEKKEFLGSFIERIEINPEPTENGQILKKIKFRIPICYDGNDGNDTEISVPTEKLTVESVVLMSRDG